jgi:hypothetical protein
MKSPKMINRFVLPAIKAAISAFEEMMIHFGNGKTWVFETFERHTVLPDAPSSRRPCPLCGSPMFYEPRRWSAFTGKYLRVCESCDYTDARAVKIVPQISKFDRERVDRT